jgi:diguanylate cyclase
MASSKGDDPSLIARGIDVILRNAKAQVTLIDDILDTARIVVGKLRISLVPTNLAAVARAAIESVSPQAVAKQITLDLVVDGDPVVMADPDRLQQVVWNLLTNAIKFTHEGGKVHISVELDGPGKLATVRVRDDGIGIANDDLPFIFDRFRQVDSSTTRAKGGLGLGLAIVRHLIEAHSGRVSATSEGRGKGATFIIELPAVPSGTPTSPRLLLRVARTDLAGVDVLIVDDEADAAELVALVLQRRGATTRIAHSAPEAMALIDARLPDVIVSDIGMPGEDGFSFLRRLREAHGPKKDIPAIALTAYTRAEDAEQSTDAGYGWHLKKPATAEQLVTAVAEAVKR